MLTIDEFSVLELFRQNSPHNKPALRQRSIAEVCGISLGKANSLVNALEKQKLVERYSITQEGLEALAPYKVDNAIIMAAGMSSRFAPVSYESPKGLLKVKGEILIERQIRQLHEKGIFDITVVVGYMKEKFYYLREKFGVDIVVNDDYRVFNNPSSLIRVLDRLSNTYICSSDDYFTDNVFEQYIYHSYYSGVFLEGKTDEWGLRTNAKGRVVEVDFAPEDMHCMMGQVYFTRDFSEKFSRILQDDFNKLDYRFNVWEKLLSAHLDELEIYLRPYDASVVHEFDSLEELRQFDSAYINNSGSVVIRTISEVLHCNEADISDIHIVKEGLTNLSFSFLCKGKSYIYRHPGFETEKVINRRKEAQVEAMVFELGLNPSFITMDPEKGWKLSEYYPDCHILEYSNKEDCKKAMHLLKQLHDAKVNVEGEDDLWSRCVLYRESILDPFKDYSEFDLQFNRMKELHELLLQDGVQPVLCHRDSDNRNFLVRSDGTLDLIDWEYAGNDDPAADLAGFIVSTNYTEQEIESLLKVYYDRELTFEEKRHCYGYIALAGYHWHLWGLLRESRGASAGPLHVLWYQFATEYYQKTLEMYR